jgi:hypothetical protein
MKSARRSVPILLALLAAPAAPRAAADEAPTAKGTFKSKTITMEVKSAVAFRGRSSFDKEDVLMVAVTNAGIKADVLRGYYDRARAVDKRVKDDETGVVLFEFGKDGAYRGYSFYFAPGNGCGYCGGGNVSTVKLAGGRLKGTLKDSGNDRSFDIALDVPFLSEDSLKVYARAEGKKDLAGYVRYLAKEHPTKAMKITKGFAGPDQAVLLVDGETSYSKVTGEVVLVKEKGTWRVDDELMDVKLD